MLRLIGYILGVFALLFVLRMIPGIGRVFAIPFLGFFLSAAILSALLGWWANRAVERRQTRRVMREFGAVDTPHNQGKLGALLLERGRFRQALPLLEKAAAGEPGFAAWHYRLGEARLGSGDAAGAVEALRRAVAADPEHQFGGPFLALSRAELARGDAAAALAAAEEFERARGETAESAYRRGLALRSLGRRDEARAAFRAVGPAAAREALGRRRAGRGFALRAWWLARF